MTTKRAKKKSSNWGGKRPNQTGRPKKDPSKKRVASGLRFVPPVMDALRAIQDEFPERSLNDLGEYCIMETFKRVRDGEIEELESEGRQPSRNE